MANLAALLDKEAGAEIENILSEARQRASEIVDKAKSEANALVEARKRAAISQAEALVVRAKSAAQLEASSLKLNTQHGFVEQALGKVKSEITALTKDANKYKPALGKLLKEASDALGGKISAIVVNPADKGIITEAAQALGLDAAIETDAAISAGVKLKAQGSNTAITNSLFDRLDSLRDQLGSEVSKLLFSEGA